MFGDKVAGANTCTLHCLLRCTDIVCLKDASCALQAVATEAESTFFAVSSSDLVSIGRPVRSLCVAEMIGNVLS